MELAPDDLAIPDIELLEEGRKEATLGGGTAASKASSKSPGRSRSRSGKAAAPASAVISVLSPIPGEVGSIGEWRGRPRE